MTATRSEPTPDVKLTARQRAVHKAAKTLAAESDLPPTVAQIAAVLKLTDEQVRVALAELERAGKVQRPEASP